MGVTTRPANMLTSSRRTTIRTPSEQITHILSQILQANRCCLSVFLHARCLSVVVVGVRTGSEVLAGLRFLELRGEAVSLVADLLFASGGAMDSCGKNLGCGV